MKTFDLDEAAEFVKLHPHTLEAMARREEVPAYKPGKRWVFIDDDLVAWLREKHTVGEGKCRSSSAKAVVTGSAAGRSAAKRLGNLLAQKTGDQRKNITTGDALNSGGKRDLVRLG